MWHEDMPKNVVLTKRIFRMFECKNDVCLNKYAWCIICYNNTYMSKCKINQVQKCMSQYTEEFDCIFNIFFKYKNVQKIFFTMWCVCIYSVRLPLWIVFSCIVLFSVCLVFTFDHWQSVCIVTFKTILRL